MWKKIAVLVVVGCVAMTGVCAAVDIPPASKLVVAGSDPEVVANVNNGVASMAFPLTLGQREKLGNKQYAWQMSVSVAHYTNGEWVLKSVEKDRYEVQTGADNGSNMIPMQYDIPKDGCDWIRAWGKSSADWLWIAPSSKYYRKAKNGKPAYEMLICSDGKVSAVPDNYPLRP